MHAARNATLRWRKHLLHQWTPEHLKGLISVAKALKAFSVYIPISIFYNPYYSGFGINPLKKDRFILLPHCPTESLEGPNCYMAFKVDKFPPGWDGGDTTLNVYYHQAKLQNTEKLWKVLQTAVLFQWFLSSVLLVNMIFQCVWLGYTVGRLFSN